MENFEEKSQQGLNYELLKQNLLNGVVSVKEVRLKLLDADQKDATHEAANENLVFLEDKEVQSYIALQPEDIQRSYERFLGFTQWHIAQNLMFEDKTEEGLEFFKKSVENSIKGQSEESWLAYGKGTIAYLQNDISTLKENIPRITTQEKNKIILERMLVSLESGKEIDYKRDY